MMDFKELVKVGVHFGHQKSRWCPKMEPYIWGHKNGVHLIDVSKTAHMLEKAAVFLESVAAEGKTILWVGTKRPAQETMGAIAGRLNMPSVTHRWVGGTLSNFPQVKKSVTKLLHYEDILSKADQSPYTKKELNVYKKIVDRLRQNVGGIQKLTMPLGAIVLVDVRKEHSALREASVMGIPVVALVDTNGDPSMVDYVIPGNDDVPRAIKLVMEYLEQAVQRGVVKASQVAEKEAAEKAAQKAAAAKEAAAKKAASAEKTVKKEEVEKKPAADKEKSAAAVKAKPAKE